MKPPIAKPPQKTAAELAAITTPDEGKLYYNSDTQKYQYWNGSSWVVLEPGGGGASAFLDLSDTPSSYSSEKQEFVQVNEAEDALIYSGRGHWGSKNKTDMEAISGARSGDSCWCTNFDKMFYYDGYCWIIPGEVVRVENRTGGSRSEGDVVVVASGFDRACDGTTTIDDTDVLGPIVQGGPEGAGNYVTVAIAGLPWNVKIAGSASRGEFIFTDNTEFEAYALTRWSGGFGQTLAGKGPGVANLACWIHSKEIY